MTSRTAQGETAVKQWMLPRVGSSVAGVSLGPTTLSSTKRPRRTAPCSKGQARASMHQIPQTRSAGRGRAALPRASRCTTGRPCPTHHAKGLVVVLRALKVVRLDPEAAVEHLANNRHGGVVMRRDSRALGQAKDTCTRGRVGWAASAQRRQWTRAVGRGRRLHTCPAIDTCPAPVPLPPTDAEGRVFVAKDVLVGNGVVPRSLLGRAPRLLRRRGEDAVVQTSVLGRYQGCDELQRGAQPSITKGG